MLDIDVHLIYVHYTSILKEESLECLTYDKAQTLWHKMGVQLQMNI